MVGVAGRSDKVEVLIKGLGVVALRVHRERPNAGNVGGLHGAKHGILEEAAAEALALPGGGNRKPGQQHDGDGMAGKALGQALGRIADLDLATTSV